MHFRMGLNPVIMECIKLSTQLANAFLDGFESRYNGVHQTRSPLSWRMHFRMGLNPVIMECIKLSTQLANALLDGFESRYNEVHQTLHSAGECIFGWV